MRSLLAAILSLFLPPRGAHRTDAPPSLAHRPPAPAPRPGPRPLHVISADGQPLVRPYVVVWERERDEREREARRLAALTPLRPDHSPWEVAV
ncbi:hypothetical protein [Streptomyces sp. HGB0020]|uniref:hypothetical protein n=1 Tax=Streptomyces sp. HGB0020 TaxID=1078086 RepID=UPI00034E66C3|nr:hypothetical protein [Streptomyces sp. HGB0020]EPD56974.1 hypothetical protein HMPREF1211_06703 [Streptomyces sp. HGB0020]